MDKFTENLFKSIRYEAINRCNKHREGRDPEDWGGFNSSDTYEYYIAKVAYEWALNGIVR